jgi:G3E family GTPase
LTQTPVTIVTGFLGSGKTTLLNRALRDPAMSRTAVVINEFGEVPIDHALTATSNDTVVVLENGCLCCTVFGDLVGTLNNLYHRREAGEVPPFDHMVIETSGLADPAPVLQAFLSEPTLAGLYRVASVVVTVDAVNAMDTLDKHDESVRQAALADLMLLTKLDLLPSGDASAAERALVARLRQINPAAEIRRADDPGLNLSAMLGSEGIDPAAGDAAAKAWLNLDAYGSHDDAHHVAHHHDQVDPGHHHHHDDVASFAFIRDQPTSRHALQLLLNALEQNLGPNLLRVKGLVHVSEEPDRPAVIQGAQHLLHNIAWLDRWPDADRRTRIVFIVQGMGRAAVEEMIALLDRVATRTAKARARAGQT